MTPEPPRVSEPCFRVGRFVFGPGILVRAALIATALAYVQTIGFGFVYDDRIQIEMNPWIQSLRFFPHYFTGNVWSFARIQVNYYRPLFTLWMALSHSVFGLTPGWWHLATVGAHVLATSLVLIFAARLLRSAWLGAIAALLFGLYPLHVECVAWVSGVPEVLLTICFLGALLAYQNWRRRRNVWWLAASLVLYAFALLAKETALALVLVLPVYSWLYEDGAEHGMRKLRNVALQTTPYIALAIAYLAVRSMVLVAVVHPAARPLHWTLLTSPAALCFYLRQLFWPFGLSVLYDFELVRVFSWRGVGLPLVLLAVVAALCIHLARRSRLLGLTSVWVMAALAPALAGIAVFQPHDYVHDRYLYLPSVATALLITAALHWLADAFKPANATAWEVAGAVMLAVVFAAFTLVESRPWESQVSLFSHAHQRAPRSALPLDYLGRALHGVGKTQEELETYREMLSLDPDYPPGNYMMGLAQYDLGHYTEAARYLAHAGDMWERDSAVPDPPLYYYLGIARQRTGDLPGAEAALRRALALKPDGLGYHLALADVLQQGGRAAEAQQELRLEAANRKLYQIRQQEFSAR